MFDPSPLTTLAVGASPVVLSVVRDELARLPRLLEHYRKMGIERFVFVDNASSDGTTAYLAAQRDVTLLQTADAFGDARFGMDWINAMRRSLPPECWTLFIDADEYLVYDGWPDVSIDRFLNTIPDRADAIVAFMLDMYPRGDIGEVDPSDDLLREARYFDTQYLFRTRPRKPWSKGRAILEVVGGPRVRLFSSFKRERRTTWVDYFIRGQIDRILEHAPPSLRRPIIERFPATIPTLKKVPFLRGHDPFYVNNHDVRGARYHRFNVVLLHFKFLSDFAAKVKREVERAQHYRFGAEYILYQKHILKEGHIVLYNPKVSGEFRTAKDLLEQELIHDVSAHLA